MSLVSKGEHYHFIGIGGIGMSGLARILASGDARVSGSDIAQNTITQELQDLGAEIFEGQSVDNISGEMTVIYSSGIKPDNPELCAAKARKRPLLHRSEMLRELMRGHQPLAVAGTHGKTTTSSLLAWVLTHAGLNPSFAIGGIVPQLGSNAQRGDGDYFVVEADESDGTFVNYHPHGAIVTNIGLDHLDHYGSEGALLESFQQFMEQVEDPNLLFFCADDPRLAAMNPVGMSYGTHEFCELILSNVQQSGWSTRFDAEWKGMDYRDIEVSLVGHHNALNALAVFGLALELGVDETKIREALRTFQGVGRRCQVKGNTRGILILDDYAHHPTEIRTTLAGIRRAEPEKRLIALFQPHRYTRTRDCLGSYAGIFEAADEVIVTDIYAAGENSLAGITPERILDEIGTGEYIPRPALTDYLIDKVRPHDVIVTLGAGDITHCGGELAHRLDSGEGHKLTIGVLYGGRSVEHEISHCSSHYIFNALQPDRYRVIPFAIDPNGDWEDPLAFEKLAECDCLFPVLHGTYGEDGTAQGLFEMLGVPYVGCDHRAAALAMDKGLTKTLALQASVPIKPFLTLSERQWKADPERALERITEMIPFPIYVKPTHLGSSVGIGRATDMPTLKNSITQALAFDNEVIVEPEVLGREIEFGILGHTAIEVLLPCELCSGNTFCDYDGKYSQNSMPIIAPADLTQELIEKGQGLARKTYEALGCSGWARIDFFLDSDGNYWLNEVNPIPGCTPTSGFPKICEGSRLAPEAFVDRVVISALQRDRQRLAKKWARA